MKTLPIVNAHGTKIWINDNGQYHRENDLPALEFPDGEKHWYINGSRHRDDDLPAIERPNGDKFWFLNGKLHRDNDLPAEEYSEGGRGWHINGKPFRKDNFPVSHDHCGRYYWYYKKPERECDLPMTEYFGPPSKIQIWRSWCFFGPYIKYT